jgi:hypothetical protein
MDAEIRAAYQALARGRLVIKALESIKTAGVKTEGLDIGFPKLALVRADAPTCKVQMSHDGSATMHAGDIQLRYGWRRSTGVIESKNVFHFDRATFPPPKNGRWQGEAVTPLVPLTMRPRRGLANYHILFEAEWSRIPPVDPFLLRRIGRADLWVVVAMWDLTPVERAVLSTRVP